MSSYVGDTKKYHIYIYYISRIITSRCQCQMLAAAALAAFNFGSSMTCSIFTGRQGGCRIILPARKHSNAAGTHVFLPFRMNTLKQWISAGRVYYNYIPRAPHCQPFQTHPHPMCTCPALKCLVFEQECSNECIYHICFFDRV